MFWLPITIVAYFLNAIAVTIDKFLLTKKIPNPAVYTFFISVLSLVALVLIPFGFKLYPPIQIIIALIAGLLFTFALLFMFIALHRHEASRVTPFMGGLQPIFVFILALIFLGEKLDIKSFIAFSVIILGSVIISWQPGKPHSKSYIMAIISTALFAASYTISKYVYVNQDFISGFIWTRVGAFIGAITLLCYAKNRRDIITGVKSPKANAGKLFLFGQVSGAISFILVNYAIAISDSVALVNALRGIEYVFLLIFVIALSKKFPHFLKEKTSLQILIQKITAIALIIVGLFILFY